ncbi:MAG TPA: hypothetical protein VNX47_02970, partial [Nevskia sp.]|nr:hypothetical protein [Nevskia sp.]
PSSRFFFCDEGRSCREAALFGYFLALLPKSNSPVGENPQLHSAKAARRAMKGQRTPRLRWIPAFAGMTSQRWPAGKSKTGSPSARG